VHDNAKRGDPRLPATDANRHGYAESRINRPPPDLNGKEALGSNPSSNPREGLEFRTSGIGSTTLIARPFVAGLDTVPDPLSVERWSHDPTPKEGSTIFGPKRLPEMGRSLDRGMREFKYSITGKDEDAHPAELPAATEPEPKESVSAASERDS
jgi:hypothetical protein